MSDLDAIRDEHSGTHVCGGHLYDASEALAGRYCDTEGCQCMKWSGPRKEGT